MTKTYKAAPNGNGWNVIDPTGRKTSHHSSSRNAWVEAQRLARGVGERAELIDKSGKVVTGNKYPK